MTSLQATNLEVRAKMSVPEEGLTYAEVNTRKKGMIYAEENTRKKGLIYAEIRANIRRGGHGEEWDEKL